MADSASRAGQSWTDHGTARQERGLKNCPADETRTVPIPAPPRQTRLRPD